mmetsp:Transcript_7316/g.13881  ORF Transcript_7316/g.13881 Transcript_7316/m.13881 type:complete len:617 (+) Transcript_7316:56-1906(+)
MSEVPSSGSEEAEDGSNVDPAKFAHLSGGTDPDADSNSSDEDFDNVDPSKFAHLAHLAAHRGSVSSSRSSRYSTCSDDDLSADGPSSAPGRITAFNNPGYRLETEEETRQMEAQRRRGRARSNTYTQEDFENRPQDIPQITGLALAPVKTTSTCSSSSSSSSSSSDEINVRKSSLSEALRRHQYQKQHSMPTPFTLGKHSSHVGKTNLSDKVRCTVYFPFLKPASEEAVDMDVYVQVSVPASTTAKALIETVQTEYISKVSDSTVAAPVRKVTRGMDMLTVRNHDSALHNTDTSVEDTALIFPIDSKYILWVADEDGTISPSVVCLEDDQLVSESQQDSGNAELCFALQEIPFRPNGLKDKSKRDKEQGKKAKKKKYQTLKSEKELKKERVKKERKAAGKRTSTLPRLKKRPDAAAAAAAAEISVAATHTRTASDSAAVTSSSETSTLAITLTATTATTRNPSQSNPTSPNAVNEAEGVLASPSSSPPGDFGEQAERKHGSKLWKLWPFSKSKPKAGKASPPTVVSAADRKAASEQGMAGTTNAEGEDRAQGSPPPGDNCYNAIDGSDVSNNNGKGNSQPPQQLLGGQTESEVKQEEGVDEQFKIVDFLAESPPTK